MDVTTCIFLLRMINNVMHIALQRSIAARRVRVEPTARLHREVRRLLHRLHREISGRLDDDRPLPTDPGDNRRPIFVIMAPTGLAFLATTTRAASQRLLATALRLALVTGGVIEVIRFHCACQLAIGFIGEGRIAQPPAPAIARAAMDPSLSGNPPRRTRQTQQKGRQNPVRQRPLALVEQRIGEIIEGALAAVTPVAFASGSVVVRPPRIDVLALAPGTLEWTIFPPQRMDVGVALVDVEELVDV